MANILEMANRGEKRSEIWNPGVLMAPTLSIFGLILLLLGLRSFGVIQCTCLRMACNSKMAGRILKRSESLKSGIPVTHIWVSIVYIYCNSCLTKDILAFKSQNYTYIAIVATWLLDISLTCSNLTSDQAEDQGPWASC